MKAFFAFLSFFVASVVLADSEHLSSFGAKGDESTISLKGEWRYMCDDKRPDGSASDFGKLYAKKGENSAEQERDRKGYGIELGYNKVEFDDSSWKVIDLPGAIGKQGIYHANTKMPYQGVIWFRQKVIIPESWKGNDVMLQLGKPDDCGVLYFNGKEVDVIKKYGSEFSVQLPSDLIRYGKSNSIVMSVANWYRDGGVNSGLFEISVLGSFESDKLFEAGKMKLDIDKDLTSDILSSSKWQWGWRDAGTSNTRPKMSLSKNAYNGNPAIVMDIWYPNTAEYIDCMLGENENGKVWKKKGFDYISFMVKSTVDGEMKLGLNKGHLVWRSNALSYKAPFYIKAGDWQKIVIPFDAFQRKGSVLDDLGKIDRISIGFGNHELHGKGIVMFADFEVGHFDIDPGARSISLDGYWRFAPDNISPDGKVNRLQTEEERIGYGLQYGYHKADFDDSGWRVIKVGTAWEKQGFPGYNGPAWYRQKVRIPAAWKGLPLRLQLGRPDDRGTVFFNGKEVQVVESFGPMFDVVISPEDVRYGEDNSISVLIYDWYKDGGLTLSPFSIGPLLDRAGVRFVGEKDVIDIDKFEMGAKVSDDKRAEIVVTIPAAVSGGSETMLDYRVSDCFYRTIADGTVPVKEFGEKKLQAVIPLSVEQTQKMFFGEWIDLNCQLKKADGTPILTFVRHREKMAYEERDKHSLSELPTTYEDTPLGKLKLVDVVEAWTDPVYDPHPYKEGGVRDFWGGRRAYAPWIEGVTVKEFRGRKYREALNEQHFGYRIGRGKMKEHSLYLLRILYPEDKPRYMPFDIKAGRNYQGVGFFTGIDGDPKAPYPISGDYQWCDHIVALDDVTYGYKGRRSVSSENGFWIFFHDIGRVYSGLYQYGPAVSEIRLYEIEHPKKSYPEIRYPDGERRVLMMDWERQPEANPGDIAEYARLMGVNALGPVFMKWSSTAFYKNSQGYTGSPEWYGTMVYQDGDTDADVLVRWLQATKKHGVTLIPRLEYGGSPALPKSARVIGPDGKPDSCGRYASWGANILDPDTWKDVETVLQEVVGDNIKQYPNIGGVLWRMRSDRVKCSYGKNDVELFCKETGREMPKGSAAEIAKWAAVTNKKAYEDWWHQKRRDFHVKMRDLLRSYRSDLKLYYYNWDGDGWSLADSNNQSNSARDWSDHYNVDRAEAYYKRKLAKQNKLTDEDYLKRFKGGHPVTSSVHAQLRPELYEDVEGIALFAPVHWDYLADNEPYINHFKTGDGLAVCNQYRYEEKGRTNIQHDNYETSEMTPAGPKFAMAVEVLSFFHGDPNVITWTPYTIGRSFITEHRKFAQAYLALPAEQGEIIENATVPASDDVRVRTYNGDKQLFISVVHKGYDGRKFTVKVPVSYKKATVTDLVTGETVSSEIENNNIKFNVELSGMELRSYRVDKM